MYKVLFVCHGNICRSPMAEFLLKNMVEKIGDKNDFTIESAATSTEEIGNPVHPRTRGTLAKHGIVVEGKRARLLTKNDYDKFDYIIGMDSENIKNILKITGADTANKVHLLLEFTGESRDIKDPWYTGDFDTTYDDIYRGCAAFVESIEK